MTGPASMRGVGSRFCVGQWGCKLNSSSTYTSEVSHYLSHRKIQENDYFRLFCPLPSTHIRKKIERDICLTRHFYLVYHESSQIFISTEYGVRNPVDWSLKRLILGNHDFLCTSDLTMIHKNLQTF
jgi:hypothetical protein